MEKLTFRLTFSNRDWRQGAELLERLGFQERLLLTSEHMLDLDEDQKELLSDELDALDLEFELEEFDESEQF